MKSFCILNKCLPEKKRLIEKTVSQLSECVSVNKKYVFKQDKKDSKTARSDPVAN